MPNTLIRGRTRRIAGTVPGCRTRSRFASSRTRCEPGPPVPAPAPPSRLPARTPAAVAEPLAPRAQALEAEELDAAEGCGLRVIQLLPHATLPQVRARGLREGSVAEGRDARGAGLPTAPTRSGTLCVCVCVCVWQVDAAVAER